MPVLIYGIETVLWREKERTRIRAIQIDCLWGLLAIGRINGVLMHGLELCGVKNRVDEGLMKLFSCGLGIFKEWRIRGRLKIYVGKCMGNRPVGRPRKR